MARSVLQVQLDFSANTAKAKKSMQELQATLNQAIATSASGKLGLTPQLEQARRSAMDLKIALQNATNVDTGKLNLTKFQAQLAASGRNIKQYAADLKSLGPAGIQAFTQMADAVMQADTKLISLSGGLKKLTDTFANTMRWQLTSSIITGITSSIQGAIDYAADLDKSLNNIQIVTGKTTAEVARFGQEAQKAAKALSAATTEYTDAALIYFQQGLSDKAVKERTDTTVKLANVVGKSAQEVSEWMTAIWNNYDDGSRSLESYADTLTALGAATASSADEIAGGLEKFSAVAETVGLSYEYAASALATITAETRQSEEVVGTALKTIFSRMESLKLGETLEDGTSLGQYSAALKKVGVDLKDASGAVKDMDIVLEELGARWQTLARDEQIALAQGVAGIRQYNQFVALMDNWDVMQENVEIAEKAAGTLERQFGAYEDSAEAHKQRMQTSAEALKAMLLGGEDLKGYYSFMDDFLSGLVKILDACGGLKTILLGVGAALLKIYQPQVGAFLSTLPTYMKQLGSQGLSLLTGGLYKGNPAKDFKKETVSEAAKMTSDSDSAGGSVGSQFTKQNLSIQQSILDNEERMTQAVKQRYEWELEILRMRQKGITKGNTEAEASSSEVHRASDALGDKVSAASVGTYVDKQVAMGRIDSVGATTSAAFAEAGPKVTDPGAKDKVASVASQGLGVMEKAAVTLEVEGVDSVKGALAEANEAIDNFVADNTGNVENLIKAFERLKEVMTDAGSASVLKTEDQLATEMGPGQTEDIAPSPVGEGEPMAAATIPQQIVESQIVKSQMVEKTASTTPPASGEGTGGEGGEAPAGTEKKKAKVKAKPKKSKNNNAKGIKAETKAIQGKERAAKKLGKTEKKNDKSETKRSKSRNKRIKAIKSENKVIDQNRKKIKNLGKAAKEYGKNQQDVNSTIDEATEAGERLNDQVDKTGVGFTGWGNTIAGLGGGIASTLMSMSMLQGAFENLSYAIASDNDTAGDWISALSSMTMGIITMIPGLAKLTEGFGNVATGIWKKVQASKAEKTATDAAAAAQEVETAVDQAGIVTDQAETAQTGANFASSMTNATGDMIEAGAGVASQMGAGPPGWVTGAVSLASVIAVGAAIGLPMLSGISAGKKQAADEKKEEDNEKTLETYERDKEVVEAHRETAVSYEELLRTYQETGQGKEELIDAANEAIEAYGLESEKVKLLTGDYEGLAVAIRKARLEEEGRLAGSSAGAMAVQADAVASGIRDGMGYTDSDNHGQYTLNIGGGTDLSSDYEHIVGDIINEVAAEYDSTELGFNYGMKNYSSMDGEQDGLEEKGWHYNELISGLDLDNPEELLQAYDIMTKTASRISSEMTRQGLKAEDSERYNAIIDWIQRAQGAGIEDLRESTKTNAESNSYIMVQNENVGDIKDIDEYWKVANRLENNMSGPIGKEAMRNQLSQSAYDKDFEFRRQEYQKQMENVTNEGLKTYLEGIYKNMDMDAVYAASSVEITEGMTKEEFEKKFEEQRVAGARADKVNTAEQYEVNEKQADAYTKALANNRKELAKFTKAGTEGERILENISKAGIKTNAEIDKLAEVWEQNSNALLSSNKNSTEYAYALANTTEAFQNFLGTDADLTDFVAANTDAIAAFMSGKEGMYEQLTMAAAESIARGDENFSNGMNEIFAHLKNNPLDLGETITDEGIMATFNNIVEAGDYTTTQLKEIFSSMGLEISFDAEGKIEEVRRIVDNAMAESNNKLKEAREAYDKNFKSLNDELSRYHEIERVQDKISKTLDRISSKKDRAYGKHRVAAINAEAQAYEASAKAQGALAKQAEQYLAQDKKDLENLGVGVKFDKSGNIANYTEIEHKLTQDLARITDIDSDQYKKAEERLSDFRDMASKYEETQDKLEDAKDQEREDMLAALDAKMEAIEYTIEVNVEINDRQLAALERKLEQMEDDDDYSAADRNTNRVKQIGEHQDNITTYTNGIKNTLKAAGASDKAIAQYLSGDASAIADLELTADQMKLIQDNTASIADEQDAIIELTKSIEDETLATFEKWHDEIDATNERLDNSITVIDNYKNIVELMGETALGVDEEGWRAMEEAQIRAAEAKVKAAKTQLDTTQAAVDRANEEYEKAREKGDKDLMEYWDEQRSALGDYLLEDQAAFTSAWSESLQTAADVFEAQMERAFDALDERLAGSFGSLEKLSESYTQQQTIADRYLDNGEKLYELSKLNRKIQQDINKSTNVKGQRELAELQEMINAYQQDSVNMSKADLEALQKRYDLKVAEIALEEAQNAKSQVRLTRNSEGGMSYVYTADQSKTDQAAQKVEDELEANRKLAEQQSNDLTSQIIENRQAMVEALRAIRREDYVDAEAYQKALQDATAFYLEQEAYFIDEKNKVIARSWITYSEDYLAYSDWSGKTIDRSKLLKESLAQDYNGMGQNSLGWVTTFGNHTIQMIGKYDAVAKSAEDLLVLLGEDIPEEGDDTSIYGRMVLGAGGWVSGLGSAVSTAQATYPLVAEAVGNVDTTLGTGEEGDGTYGLLLAHAGTYNDNLRTKMSESSGIYKQVSDACDLCDEALGDGSEDSDTSYAHMLTHADTFGGNLAQKLADAGGAFDNVLNGTATTTGAKQMEETLGNITTEGSIFYQTNQNALDWQESVDGIMADAGISMDQVRKAAKDKLNGDNSASTEANTFNQTIKDEMYGEGGTADNPTGGVIGSVQDVEEELDELKDEAETSFSGAADSASTHLPELWDMVDDNEEKIDDLNDALDELEDKNVTADADVDVDGTDDLDDLNDQLERLTDVLDDLTSGTINVKVTKTIVTETPKATNPPKARFVAGEGVNYNGPGVGRAGPSQASGMITDSYYDEDKGTWMYQLTGSSTYYEEKKLSNSAMTVGFTYYRLASVDDYDDFVWFKDATNIGGFSTLGSSSLQYVQGANGGLGYLNVMDEKTASDGNTYVWLNATRYDGKSASPAMDSQGRGLYINKKKLVQLDTGGYTGEWGPEGRLAMLHQKEIVLNAHDTENLLSIVNVVREMASQLDLNAMVMAKGLGAFSASMAVQSSNGTLEQTVHITAEFPNATDRNEISAAFGDIVNLASQYANRK